MKIELILRRQAGSAFQSVDADTLKDLKDLVDSGL